MTKTNVQPIPSNSQRHDTPNNKTHVIQFRVTAEEKASLELTCKLLNLSLSTFIRRAIHNVKMCIRDRPVTDPILCAAASAFDFGGPMVCDPHHYGEGHINDTIVVWRANHTKRFILQRINTDRCV